MGCGASKSAGAAVVPQQEKSCQDSVNPAAATGLPESQDSSQHISSKKAAFVLADAAGSKAGDMGVGAGSFTKVAQPRTPSEEGLVKLQSAKVLIARMSAESQPVERPTCGDTDRPASAASSSSSSGAEPENPARAAFRARVAAASTSPDGQPSSPVAFRSSRSLNRSIGVRRRISEQGTQQQQQQQRADEVDEPPQAADEPPSQPAVDARLMYDDDDDEEEDDDKSPDPLREQFELMKERNPLLVVGRQPTGTGILSCKPSEKSLKSHKRLMVGFALDDGGGGVGVDVGRPSSGGSSGGGSAAGPGKRGSGSGSSTGIQDLDPGQDLPAERIGRPMAAWAEPAPMVDVQGATSAR